MRFRWALAALLPGAFLPREALAEVHVYGTEIKGQPVQVALFGFASPRLSVQEHDDRPQVQFAPNPAFTMFRSRLGVAGRLSNRAELRFEIEMGKDFTQAMDAYVEGSPLVDPMATVSIRFGQFRVPFSRQNLIPSGSFQLPDPAYWVTPKYVVDRDIGAMVIGRFWSERIKLSAGVWNGNEPGRGQTINTDGSFLWAGRLEVSPFGAPPNHEGDLRDDLERKRPAIVAGGGAMWNTQEDKHYDRLYVGGDIGVWWQGASLYGEIYRRTDKPNCVAAGDKGTPCARGVVPPAPITAEGWNIQLGYFPHLPWIHEHIEIVGRVQRFDPYVEVKKPGADAGERELDQSNPTWGYMGYQVGLNVFPLDWGHNLKVQASYEIRNELKKCLAGQAGNACTGFINNNLFLLQGTVGF